MKNYRYKYHQLHFKQPSGTSRGIIRTKDSWIIYSENDKAFGEISIIDGLSIDHKNAIENYLIDQSIDKDVLIRTLPAVAFAQEILALSSESIDSFKLFDSSFSNGEVGIPINGLVWMGDKKFMFDQIVQKIETGFDCIKLKIGAIDFDEEIELLAYVRKHFSAKDIELRVDANGAFKVDQALEKLKILSSFEVHSIEQPIQPRQWDEMANLCAYSPIDIALDEELIGISEPDQRKDLLRTIKPQYIILKPSLIGGFEVSENWIRLAEQMNIAWWATSALESNIGLNAIAQWVSTKNNPMPQGLGTGQLYTNNFESPLTINNGRLYYDKEVKWDLNQISH